MTNRMGFYQKIIMGALCFFSLGGHASETAPMKIITTFSILGDFVKEVGKDKVVISIVGPNCDAHIYEPTPKDVKNIAHADIVFVNGLGFEGWMDRLIESSGYEGDIITATRGVKPRALDDAVTGTVDDPHAWHNVQNVKIYVQNIMQALIKQDPDNKAFFEKNGKAYLKKLDALDKWVQVQFTGIPAEHRKIITAHDAFGYFGEKYGVTFLAPVGISTAAEPTVKSIVNLIKEIRKYNVKTIFVENISNSKLIEQICEETGATMGDVIYSDALSEPSEPGGTYLKLMRHNVTLFSKAMAEMSS